MFISRTKSLYSFWRKQGQRDALRSIERKLGSDLGLDYDDNDEYQILGDNPCHYEDVFFDGIQMLGKVS